MLKVSKIQHSRMNVDALSYLRNINLKEMYKDQNNDKIFSLYRKSNCTSLKFKLLPIPSCRLHIWCDISTELSRICVSEKHRNIAFPSLHKLSQRGIAASLKLITWYEKEHSFLDVILHSMSEF